MNHQLKHLIQKYSEGNLSLREQIELFEQLADSHDQESEQLLHENWQIQLESDLHSTRDFKPILEKIHHQIRINEYKSLQVKYWRIFQRVAAILIIPLLFSFLTYYYFQSRSSDKDLTYAEIQCPLGVRTKFQLPDGTTGYLNGGSQLKYPVPFKMDRKVELSGEALFNVVHDEKSPFHVLTSHLDIKVVGTTFNVIAYKEENTEEIILQQGKVNVSSKSGHQLAALLPNEQLILDVEKRNFTKQSVEALQYTTWTEGKLVFRNEKMQQVARRLGRWYNAEVILEDKLLEDYSFHATFVDEPLDEVLKLISLTSPLKFNEAKRESNSEGVFPKRKIVLSINKSKINQFK